jgi:hypothetical protein
MRANKTMYLHFLSNLYKLDQLSNTNLRSLYLRMARARVRTQERADTIHYRYICMKIFVCFIKPHQSAKKKYIHVHTHTHTHTHTHIYIYIYIYKVTFTTLSKVV